MDIGLIAQVCAILIIAGWIVYKELRERHKVKEYELLENPERCRDHEQRLRCIEKDCSTINTTLAVMAVKLEAVDDRLETIGGMFGAVSSHVN